MILFALPMLTSLPRRCLTPTVRRPLRHRRRCRVTPLETEGGSYEIPNKKGEATTNFTPFVYMQYDLSPENFCQHEAAIEVEAPVERCFEIWNTWDNLVDFLDLIGEICLDGDPMTAVFFCYYRYWDYPLMQIMIYLKKTEIKENVSIAFKSSEGMPLAGIVEFESIDDDRSFVRLRFEHAMPHCLLSVKIGTLSVEHHMRTILEENMATFKLLAEGKIPFSEEKYNRDRALTELEEMRKAYYRSGWISTEEQYDPTDLSDYGRSINEYEVLKDNDQ